MKKHGPVLVAAGVALLIVSIALAMKGKTDKPVVASKVEETTRKPMNANLVEIDWHGNEAYFPEPMPIDGKYWNIAFSDGSEDWQSKRVTSRKDGRLYTGFPAGSKQVDVWVGGGHRPTYSVPFYKP